MNTGKIILANHTDVYAHFCLYTNYKTHTDGEPPCHSRGEYRLRGSCGFLGIQVRGAY